MNDIPITKIMAIWILQILLISGQCNRKRLKRMVPRIGCCCGVQWNDLFVVDMWKLLMFFGMCKKKVRETRFYVTSVPGPTNKKGRSYLLHLGITFFHQIDGFSMPKRFASHSKIDVSQSTSFSRDFGCGTHAAIFCDLSKDSIR